MNTALTTAQIAQYQRDGLLFPIRVLETDTARGYLKLLEAAEASGGPLKTRRAFKLHLLYPFLYQLVTLPAILNVVETVLGPDFLVYSSGLFIKEPHTAHYVAWHQDQVHFGLAPAEAVTAWLALGDVDQENGAMRMLPGSQRANLLQHEDVYTPDNVLSRGEEIREPLDDAEAVDVVLKAGEISLHQLMMVHSSPANHSPRRRVGLVIRYIPTKVRQSGGPDGAMLVRGEDRYGNFMAEVPPVHETDTGTLTAYERAMTVREGNFFKGATPPTGRRNHAGLQ